MGSIPAWGAVGSGGQVLPRVLRWAISGLGLPACVCVLCRLHICTCVFQCVVCAIKNLTKVLIIIIIILRCKLRCLLRCCCLPLTPTDYKLVDNAVLTVTSSSEQT